MTRRIYSNNFFSSLLVALSSSATTLYLASTTNLPTIGSNYFYLTLDDLNGGIEIVKVTAVTSNALTITRGQEGTTARAWAIHSLIELRPTALSYDASHVLSDYSLTTVTPASGDIFFAEDASDSNNLKGVTMAAIASYAAAAGIADGDKGDVIVSSSGSVWTIDTAAVSLAKMADLATSSLIGRNTAGTGVPEALSYSTVKTGMSLNNVENTALSTWAGSSSITTVGTLSSLTFGQTALSYYGEGTWTPAPAGASVAGSPTGTFSGHYTRIGRQVFGTARLTFTSLSTMSGNFQISGLPFTCKNSTGADGQVCILSRNNMTNEYVITAMIPINGTTIQFYDAALDNTNVSCSDLSATTDIALSFAYNV